MKTILAETLYALTKVGKTKVWEVEVKSVNKGKTIIEIRSQNGIDAKPVIRQEEITEGKNLGRANETTPEEQALAEALSRIDAKIKQGYSKKKPAKNATHNVNALGFLQPMLAHSYDKVKDVKFPCYMQPKFDGHRAMVTLDSNGKPIMFSRRGGVITSMTHITPKIKGLKPGEYIDGELYIHGMALQDIASLIKKYRPGESERVSFHGFDMICPGTYKKRYSRLNEIVTKSNLEKFLLALTYEVDSYDLAMENTIAFIELGYEGSILRLPDSEYEPGVRSRNLLKIKVADDSEYTIRDVIPGKEVTINGTKYTPGIFICQTAGKKPFEAMAYGTYPEKSAILKNKKKYIGKLLTVKHFGYTKDGIPWHPVAMRMRCDI